METEAMLAENKPLLQFSAIKCGKEMVRRCGPNESFLDSFCAAALLFVCAYGGAEPGSLSVFLSFCLSCLFGPRRARTPTG